jgi:hypothetical protein
MHWMNLQQVARRTADDSSPVCARDEVRVEDTAAVRDLLDAAAEGARLMHPLAINSALLS